MPNLDQTIREYRDSLAPPPPSIAPGTSLRRDVPIRAPAVGADVGVPFLLALASATVTFISVGVVVTSVTVQLLKLTILPKRRFATSLMACVPNIVASVRSNAVGVPPRCT